MCIDEKQAGQLIIRLDNVEKSTAKTVESLYGDGKPGILERVGKIEVNVQNVLDQSRSNNAAIEKVLEQADELATKAVQEASRLVEKTETKSLALIRQVTNDNTKIINDIKVAIEEIKDSVTKHQGDKDLHTFRGLFFKRDILVWVVVGFLFLHSLLPQDVDIWEIIRSILGL